MSKRKRKNKIVKLTDKDYGDYIMALKEETPVRPIVPAKGKYDDTGA